MLGRTLGSRVAQFSSLSFSFSFSSSSFLPQFLFKSSLSRDKLSQFRCNESIRSFSSEPLRPDVVGGVEKTALTLALWGLRHPIDIPTIPTGGEQLVLLLPFKQRRDFQAQYEAFWERGVRVGRFLEDLDAFACSLAYRHCNFSSSSSTHRSSGSSSSGSVSSTGSPTDPTVVDIVTACCDRIDFRAPLKLSSDYLLQGRISWVGSTSMEATLWLSELRPSTRVSFCRDSLLVNELSSEVEGSTPISICISNEPIQPFQLAEFLRPGLPVVEAKFLMVARAVNGMSESSKKTKFQVPPLQPSKDDFLGQELVDEGARNKERRLQESKTALWAKPPSSEELHLVHSFFMDTNRDRLMMQQISDVRHISSPFTSPFSSVNPIMPLPIPSAPSEIPPEIKETQMKKAFLSMAQAAVAAPSASSSFWSSNQPPPLFPLLRIPINQTYTQSLMICHPQMQNTSGKIFGGLLMRNAMETGWTCAYLHSLRQYNASSLLLSHSGSPPDRPPYSVSISPSREGSASVINPSKKVTAEEELRCPHPVLLAIDDISFLHPVEIGSIIQFSAVVAYSTSRAVQVRVDIHTRSPNVCNTIKTNVFHFTFASLLPSCNPEVAIPSAPLVFPETYEEAMEYLDGRRRLLNSRNIAIDQHSPLAHFF